MDKNSLIQYYIQQELAKQQNQNDNTLGKIKQTVNNVNTIGQGLSTVGNVLGNVNNKFVNSIGTGLDKAGSFLSNGATKVSDVVDIPQNYFKGVADRSIGEGLSKIGSSLANNSGVVGQIGETLGNAGASLAGGATGATTGATTAGTSAAAGGAAEGAGGAAAAGPLGALISLGVMALKGDNRKGAEKEGQQMLQATNDMAVNRQKNNLSAVQQNSAAMQQEAQQNLGNALGGTMTGGASEIESLPTPQYLQPTPNGGATQGNLLSDYQDYLRNKGYSDEVVSNVALGKNSGVKEIDNWIKNQAQMYGQNFLPNTQTAEQPMQTGSVEVSAGNNQVGNQTASNPTGATETNQTEDVKRSLLDKFISGISDLSKGYDENRNSAFSPANLKNDKFVDYEQGKSQALTDYENQLKAKGYDENVINAVAQGKNSGNKDIDEWIKANPDALKPVSNPVYTEKTKMGRVGEALGTLARTLNRPGVQGLIAGGLSTALTGNPLYGLGQGYEMAKRKANTDMYSQVMKDNGVNVNTGMLGTLDNKDMSAMMMPQYKEAMNNMALAKLEELKAYHEGMLKNNAEKIKNDKAYKDKKLVIDNKKVDKQGTGEGGGTKPQSHPDWNNDLAGYVQRYNDPKYANVKTKLKQQFISKYGVDPDKYIKSSGNNSLVLGR